MKPMVMTASICGNKTLDNSPHMPVTFDLSVADGIKSFQAGAAQLHIHGRDRAGNHTFEPGVYGELIAAFREKCPGAVIQASAGDTYQDPEGLLIPLLKLKPDLLSLAVQETAEKTLTLLEIFDEYGVRPIVESFNIDQTRQVYSLFKEGQIKLPLNLEVVFEGKDIGRPFSALAAELLEVAEMAKDGSIVWSICGGDNHESATQALAIALGGHVRTGLEDRYQDFDGEYFTESLCTVLPALEMCKMLGRPNATTQQAREILGV